MDTLSSLPQAQNATDLLAVQAQQTGLFRGKVRTEAAYEKTARDFEAVFMAQMLQPMFEGLDVDDMFGGGHGEEMMRGLLTQEYGKAMAAQDQSGLSDAIKEQMIQLQAEASGKTKKRSTRE